MNTISYKFTRFKQSCHCAICQAAARASGRVGATRRAAAYSTASFRQLITSPYVSATAIYTSMVACAMTMDGRVKTDRLIKWESAIAFERSTIRLLSAEESRIKKKLAERLPLEDDLPDVDKIEETECLDEQQLLEKADDDILEERSSIGNSQQSRIARRNSEPSQDHAMIHEEDTDLHMEEISDWQKAYIENPCEHGQALELNAPVLGPEQQIENIDPQSIYAPPKLRQLLYSHRWTPKKLRTAEIVTARLVVQLLLHHKLHDMTNPISTMDHGIDIGQDGNEENMSENRIPAKIRQLVYSSREKLQELNNCLYMEKEAIANIDPFDEHYDESLPEIIPTYSQDPSGKFHKVIRKVNDNIYSNFYKYHAGEIDLQATIVNICNELLTSSAAPNLHTYNMLLIELSSVERSPSLSLSFTKSDDDTAFTSTYSSPRPITAPLAKAVAPIVDSIFTALRDAKIRPNETTCAAMLNHYTQREDAEAFARLVILMRGGEDGLMLARPNITYDPGGSMRRRLKPKVGRTNKIIQAVTPTPTVAEALIGGVLRFVGLEHALETIENLAQDGWAFDERGLSAIVCHCAYKKDWKNGVAFWNRIRDLVVDGAQLRNSTSVSSEGNMSDNPSPSEMSNKPSTSRPFRLSLTAYRAYITLCWNCNQPEDLRATVEEAVQKCRYSIRSLLTELKSRDRSRAYMWLRNCVSDEEMKEFDRRKARNKAIFRLKVAAMEQENSNADDKQPSRNENESKLEWKGEWEQDQETKVENPIISTLEPSPSTIITPIPTILNQNPATSILLASSPIPETVLDTSPSSIDTNLDTLVTAAEERQRHLQHTPSTPTPKLTSDANDGNIPNAPLPTITSTSALISPADAQPSNIPSSSQSSLAAAASSSLSSSSPLPMLPPTPSPAPSLTLSSSSLSSSSSSRTTTKPETATPSPVQQPRPSSLPSPSLLLLPTSSPFFNDAIVDVDMNTSNVNVSNVDPHDIPPVGIIST